MRILNTYRLLKLIETREKEIALENSIPAGEAGKDTIDIFDNLFPKIETIRDRYVKKYKSRTDYNHAYGYASTHKLMRVRDKNVMPKGEKVFMMTVFLSSNSAGRELTDSFIGIPIGLFREIGKQYGTMISTTIGFLVGLGSTQLFNWAQETLPSLIKSLLS